LGMNSIEIRQRFVDFYQDLGFHLLPRAPMLHQSITMSFVMSAGLVQVETALTSSEPRDGNQFVLVQECFRHFDLDKVGTDDIHLSMFEMPGAFVFDSNGKTETVRRMWHLATSVFEVDPDRIWVSYFRGGTVLGNNLPPDETTRQTWINLGIAPERIVGLVDDNYWVQGGGIDGMGTPRKAGPNTEIFFERGTDKACSPHCRPGCKCGRFVEFSNSLFICKEVDEETGQLHPMTEPFLETVIGTERLAMILQKVPSVFDTDIFRPLIVTIRSLVNVTGLPETLVRSSERVIADYGKALYVLVIDGAPAPGKDGRERIIKLLIRGILVRAVILNLDPEKLLPAIISCISQTISDDLRGTPDDEQRLQTYFAHEAHRFAATLQRGREKLHSLIHGNNGDTLTGKQIVHLEKERGIHRLLTAHMLQQQGLTFAEMDYWQALRVWKEGARA